MSALTRKIPYELTEHEPVWTIGWFGNIRCQQSLAILTELAEMCGYSESHFRRLFRDVVGVTPKQYIKKTKMEYALYLLRDEKLPVKEVAATLGYNDTFEFSKQFKTVYGVSPSKKARSAD